MSEEEFVPHNRPMSLEDFDARNLAPGIRDKVVLARNNNFLTCDSGDGSGAIPFPHVFAPIALEFAKQACDAAEELFPDAEVEVSYSNHGGAILMIMWPEPKEP
jgi:hypothetical protein